MPFLALANLEDSAFYRAALEKPMSAPALLLTLLFALLVFSRSRPTALVAVIAAIAYLPQTEAVNFGFHFYAIRIIVLIGILRVLVRGENKGFRLEKIDKAVLGYALAIFTISCLRDSGELTVRLGGLYDGLLSYFLFRFLLKNETDFHLMLRRAAYALIPFAAFLLYETVTNHNAFSLFNGIPEASWVRTGHTRAQGPFRNPITAGSFGATFTLFYGSLFFSGNRQRFVFVGLAAGMAIVFSSHSSGPFLGVALALLAFFCWRWRGHLKQILLGAVGLLLVMQLFMNAPIWFLIGRISEVTGGGGYHRSELINQAIHYFDRWWLMGTVNTADWFPYEINGKADITNFFIAAGVDAGILGLFVAVALIACCFKTLGRGMAANFDRQRQRFLWGIGSTLVGTIGILFSVTYADQMIVVWYLLLAAIPALARPASLLNPRPIRAPARNPYARYRNAL